MEHYLDNSATTRVCPEAAEAALKAMTEVYGNPSSTYTKGREAKALLDKSRRQVADALGCQPGELVFTSCGSESDNWAVLSGAEAMRRKGKHVITSLVEHDAVRKSMEELAARGYEVTFLKPDKTGAIPPEAVKEALRPDTILVSLMLVNNETGAVTDIPAVFRILKEAESQALLHVDAVQAFCKIPFTPRSLGADMISVSGHKIHAPKGIGALYIRKGLHIPALLMGGGQEKNMRSGTESVPLICGFGEAVKHYSKDIAERLENAKKLESLLFELCEKNGGIGINFRGEKSPYVTSITVDGLKSEVLLHYLEKRGIFVSSGSACSKGKKSGVLAEFRIPVQAMDTTLRISFSPDTTEEDLHGLMEGISAAQSELARLK